MYNMHEYGSMSELNSQLAADIALKLKQAICDRGQATLAVSGGKTPVGLFKALSQQAVELDKVFITLVDDRWVAPEHESSNELLVKTYLLQNAAKSAHFTGLKNLADTPFEGAAMAHKQLTEDVPLPADVMVLGMGDDGHTASLFPGAKQLALGLDMHSDVKVIGMTPLTAPLDRITLTLPVILSSRHLYLHLVGSHKKEVLEKAEQGQDVNEMPIRAVLHQDLTPLQVYWSA